MGNGEHLKGVGDNGTNEQAEPELRNYLAFDLHDLKDRFVYVVSREEYERVSDEFQGIDEEFSHFISFNDRAGKRIHIRRMYVTRAQSLFDSGVFKDKIIYQSADQRATNPISIYVIGRVEPFEYNHLEDSDVEDLNEQLDEYSTDTDFIVFTDADGEQNSIRADVILLVESWASDGQQPEESHTNLEI